MKKLSRQESLIWASVAIAGLTLFVIFQSRVVPLTKVDVTVGRNEAASEAEQYLKNQGFDLSGIDSLYQAVQFLPSSTQQSSYQVLNFSEEDFRFLEERSPAYYWRVSWYNQDGRRVYTAYLSPAGHPFGFEHYIPEDVPGDSLTQAQAKQVMDDFLVNIMHINLDNYELLEVSSDKQKARMDYYLSYYSKYDFPGEIQLQLRTTVRGSDVHRVVTFYHMPERLLTETVKEIQNDGMVRTAIVPSIMVVIFIVLSVLYILRFHAGEIAIKAPIVVGIIYTVIMIVMALNSFDTWPNFGFGSSPAFHIAGYLLVFALLALLGAVMILLSWSVGDSIVREKWGYKLTLFDKIASGRVMFPSLLPSVSVGYAAGLFMVGLWSALSYVIVQYGGGWTESRGTQFLFTSYIPAFEVIGEAVTDSLFYGFIGILFLLAYFKKYLFGSIRNPVVNTALALLLMAILISGSQSLIPLYPLTWRFALTVLTSLLLGLVFVGYDLVAVLVAGFVLSIVPYSYELLHTDHFFASGVASYIFAFAPLAFGLVAYWKGRELTPEELATKPSYVRLITQRERMAQELEIARAVQMSLLPKQNPLLENYDIAGICIPALEVGGDYYDFFQLGDGRMGIAIGDVSGKGVPAAIYMTLTKGILQTCASDSISPKQVLNKLNKQIYTNIERNSFVSMFYAVLDMNTHTIRFARAGHNPAILVHRGSDNSTLLEPKGMAVGLESGDKFDLLLEEHEIKLNPGDVLTFYTDGFTEASTADGREYGEDMLFDVISQNKQLSANVIIQKVVRAIKTFVGNHPQHDDMTMVVIKVGG